MSTHIYATMKRKSIAMQIAEHFSCDVADIREYDYQPGTYAPKVYCGMDGNNYWSAGPRPPRATRYDSCPLVWVRVESHWRGNGPLWVAKGDGT